jgi:hypothetical protein
MGLEPQVDHRVKPSETSARLASLITIATFFI